MRPWPWHSSCPGGSPPPPMSHRTRSGTVKTLPSRQPRFCDYCRRLVSGRDRSWPVCGSGMLMKKKICSREKNAKWRSQRIPSQEFDWFFPSSHLLTTGPVPPRDRIMTSSSSDSSALRFPSSPSCVTSRQILEDGVILCLFWGTDLFFLLCDEHEWEWFKDECRNCRWMQPSYYLRSTIPQVWISIINGDWEMLLIRQNWYHLA